VAGQGRDDWSADGAPDPWSSGVPRPRGNSPPGGGRPPQGWLSWPGGQAPGGRSGPGGQVPGGAFGRGGPEQPPPWSPPADNGFGARGSDGDSPLVRPYAVTGGRTQPRTQLPVEAMVAASTYEPRDLSVLSPECQAILGFCRDWRSVAEISAVLRLPLGVARILIADMAVDGLVRVHQTNHADGRPNVKLLERVLSGLRQL
jgi:hypothetical protein